MKQANNSMRFELDLAKTQMKILEFNEKNDSNLTIRPFENES